MSAESQPSDHVECKSTECNQTFAHQQAMRSHYTQKHGRSQPEKLCELDGCDDVVTSRGDDARFCSRECSAIAKQNRVSVTCDQCRDSYKIKKSHAERDYDSNYCSTQCKALGQRTGEHIECDYCDESFYRNQARLNGDKTHHYCTLQCKALDRRTGEYVECASCYKQVYRKKSQLNQEYDKHYCSRRCKDIGSRTRFGYGGTLRRYTRPDEFGELVRHAYIYEGHTFEATCRIVNAELDGDFSEEKVQDVVEGLKNHERNVRNRVWALRPEDLGLSPMGEVAR